ncbi:MAG: DUF1640 domain-containing protein [Candidatus Lambdaproteobacteria bacterium]|nr:DUF1640 domain-containing protein [Candidatus Lambdaproteobacteria bacterium]
MSTLFDTHAHVKKLTAAGMSESLAEVQAQALRELITDRLATKQDLNTLEVALKRDIEALEVALKRDMKELELRMPVKLGAMMAASVAIVAVRVKLL